MRLRKKGCTVEVVRLFVILLCSFCVRWCCIPFTIESEMSWKLCLREIGIELVFQVINVFVKVAWLSVVVDEVSAALRVNCEEIARSCGLFSLRK